MISFTLPPDAFANGYTPWAPDPAMAHYFPDGTFAPWVYYDDYIGSRMDCPAILRAPDADVAYRSKYDLPAASVDAYAVVADLPSILPAAAPQITTTANGTAPVYAWGGTPIHGGWHSGGRTVLIEGDRIIGGTSSTTIIRKVIHRDGDTVIVIIRPDPTESCGCVEPPVPQPSPVSIEAGTGAMLVAAVLMMVAKRKKPAAKAAGS